MTRPDSISDSICCQIMPISAFFVSKPHELWPLSHCKTWRPQGESNPRRRRERAVSWASRRWGRWTFQEERIVEIPVRASSMGRIR